MPEVMQMQQILLYKPDSGLKEVDIERLRTAGYVPLCVTSFDQVRLMDMAGAVPANMIFVAAMEAITQADSNSGPRTLFGQALAMRLKKMFLVEKKSDDKP